MTARERVRSTQRALGLVVGSSALFWGAAVLFAGLSIVAGINAFVPMPAIVRGALPIIAGLIGLGVLAWVAWRGRFAWTFDKVALWIEEQAPELRYALVTAVDPRYAESVAPLMEPVVSRVDTGAFVRKTATRSTLPALAAMIVMAVIYFMIPAVYKPKPDFTSIFTGKSTPVVMGNRLKPLNGTLTPPSYTGWKSKNFVNPSTIAGLMGSRVVLTGRGTPDGIVATLTPPSDPTKPPPVPKQLPVTAGGDGWRVVFEMTDSIPAMLLLTDRQYKVQAVVAPQPDEPPTARLLSPERDTTYRDIKGSLVLNATFADEVGLARTYYDFIISNLGGGGGDAAESRQCQMGVKALGGTTGSNSITLPYTGFFCADSLGHPMKLKEGDQISVRAVVYDNNTYNGPGVGYSEARTIRFALKSEYDSLSINAAPPSADTALLSLRMLIGKTDTLYNIVRGHIERKIYEDSSQTLGGVANMIKGKIQRIIDEQSGGGEVNVNPLLDTAVNAMTEAETDFLIAEPGQALPLLKTAWRLLKQYQELAKKHIPRGKLKVDLVNIDRVRMAGEDTSGHPLPRDVNPREYSQKERMRLQYESALNQLRTDPAGAIPSFELMSAQVLRSDPRLAKALGDVVEAINNKKDVSLPLLRVRREFEGKVTVIDTLPRWSGAW